MKKNIFMIIFAMVFAVSLSAQQRVQMSSTTRDSLVMNAVAKKDTTVTVYNTATGSQYIVLYSPGKKRYYCVWLPKKQ